MPVFDRLQQRQDDWVRQLLALPRHGTGRMISEDVDFTFGRGYWGADERPLLPPVSLLSWLIRNFEVPPGKPVDDDRRARLAAGDPATVESALAELRTAGLGKGWHVLEGASYPDVFIETPDTLVVVEGKRTEIGPTTHTSWMATRHQMWRHIDAAWEIRGRRLVLGFFIVEGRGQDASDVPEAWAQAARDTLSAAAIEGSFPHRSQAEREGIIGGFLGATTWQAVCAQFDIDYTSLPDRVVLHGEQAPA
ncbi:MAG: hypothetical protein R2712_12390 [Vicinamibacterales bacterium]